MLEAYARSYLQPLFTAIAVRLQASIQPCGMTVLALLSGMSAGACIAGGLPILALILMWFSGLCDSLDGTLARLNHTSSPLGGYIDLIADRMVEGALILGFAWAYPSCNFACLLFLVAVLLHFSTFLAAGALFANTGPKSIHYDVGLIERAEAFIIFSAMLLMTHYMYVLLMALNLAIFCDASARFMRVVRFACKDT